MDYFLLKLKHDHVWFFGSNGSSNKSDLFTTNIAFFFNKSLKKPLKSTLLASITTSLRSAFSALIRDNLIPFFSISSFEFLIPAVSEIMTGYPSILNEFQLHLSLSLLFQKL